jgi:hypothetical protein
MKSPEIPDEPYEYPDEMPIDDPQTPNPLEPEPLNPIEPGPSEAPEKP